MLAVLPVICQESIVGETFLHPEGERERERKNFRNSADDTDSAGVGRKTMLVKSVRSIFMALRSGQTLARRFYRHFFFSSFLSNRRVCFAFYRSIRGVSFFPLSEKSNSWLLSLHGFGIFIT